uniref:Uncharacterized protein n=1 Tax=Rhizophora mucronata TaxID=61149 RepID=A0A2P2IYI3_RHIMU
MNLFENTTGQITITVCVNKGPKKDIYFPGGHSYL